MATVDVDLKTLLQAGAHFGHKTSRWHPRMAQYIHSKRGDSHIIDLVQTKEQLEKALDLVAENVAQGKKVLFVATKKQAQNIVFDMANEIDQPFVTERWLGGMLTNWNTIGGRIKELKDLEAKMESGELAKRYSKLEVQRFQEQIDEMNRIYGGIKNMPARPGAVFVFDVISDVNAVREATKLGLPIIGLTDTNADPTVVTLPVPINDDAIKTIELVTDYIKQAVAAGQAKVKNTADKDEK